MSKTDAEIAAETAAAEAKAAADKKAAEEADSQRKADEDKKNEQRKRTEREKAEYSLKKNAQRVKELGGNPDDVLGSSDLDGDDEDSRPVTHGDLKRMEAEKASKTAEQLADAIEDDKERELVKDALRDLIKPSGNPQTDIANAQAIVNSERNRQKLEEAERARKAKTHSSSGSGAQGGTKNDDFMPTAEEAGFMKPPFNLTKEKILEARSKAAGL